MTTYDPKTGETLLLTAEVALLFNVTTRTICYWANQGKLPCIKTHGKHNRFRISDVEKLLNAHGKAQSLHRALTELAKEKQ